MTKPIKPVKKGVYITGTYADSAPIPNYHAGYWLDGAWNTLATPPGMESSLTGDMCITDKAVYILGTYWNFSTGQETIEQIGYWKNGEWITLDTRNENSDMKKTAAHIVVAENGDVYISGTQYGEMNNVGYWLNNTWYDLPVPSVYEEIETAGICIDNGNVYISGYWRDKFNGMTPCYWLNGNRHDLPRIEINSYINHITVSGDKVYMLDCSFGYWINDERHELPRKGSYKGIGVCGNDVYIIGQTGYWLNKTWNNLAPPADTISYHTSFIAISGSDIYISGSYTFDPEILNKKIPSDAKFHPCYWHNGTLYLLPEPAGAVDCSTGTIAVVTE